MPPNMARRQERAGVAQEIRGERRREWDQEMEE
jgi:hypothetical protein